MQTRQQTPPSWEESTQTNFGFRVDVFLVVRVKEVGHAVVRNLDLVVVFEQDVARRQVPVHHAVFLQVVHALRTQRHVAGCSLFCHRLAQSPQCRVNDSLITHFGDLHAPVEQPLGVQAALVVPDVFQQGATSAELGHQLQTGPWADAQQPDDIGMVQAAHGEHVLYRENHSTYLITKSLLNYSSSMIDEMSWSKEKPQTNFLQYFVRTIFIKFQLICIQKKKADRTLVTSANVCRPVLSWMVFIATGIFTVSPSGIQKPFNNTPKTISSANTIFQLQGKGC